MAVPGVELVIGMVLERAVPPAIERIKALYAHMGWSKDRRRVQVVQTEVGATIERAASLARVIPPDHLQPYVDQSLADFKQKLLSEQIPAEDAESLTTALARQIETTVIEPLRHLSLIRDRLEGLEGESGQLRAKADTLDTRLQRLEERSLRFSQALWFALGAIAVLSTVALVLALMRS